MQHSKLIPTDCSKIMRTVISGGRSKDGNNPKSESSLGMAAHRVEHLFCGVSTTFTRTPHDSNRSGS